LINRSKDSMVTRELRYNLVKKDEKKIMKKLVIILFFSLSLNMPIEVQSSWMTAAKVAAIPALWVGNTLLTQQLHKKIHHWIIKNNSVDNDKHLFKTPHSRTVIQSSIQLSISALLLGGGMKVVVWMDNKTLPGKYEMYTQGYIEKNVLPAMALNQKLDTLINGNMFTTLAFLSFVPTITYGLCQAYNCYTFHQLIKKWKLEEDNKKATTAQSSTAVSPQILVAHSDNYLVPTPLIREGAQEMLSTQGTTEKDLTSAQNTGDELVSIVRGNTIYDTNSSIQSD